MPADMQFQGKRGGKVEIDGYYQKV
jgi:hypothetical protein